MAECWAIVPFERTPRFLPVVASAALLAEWDPYAVLGLPRESESQVLAQLSGDATRSSRARIAQIRDAYLDLAARFHPDGSSASRSSTAAPKTGAPWISAIEHFNAITAAYKLLSDPMDTLAYLRACQSAAAKAVDGSALDVSVCSAGGRAACATPRAYRPRPSRAPRPSIARRHAGPSEEVRGTIAGGRRGHSLGSVPARRLLSAMAFSVACIPASGVPARSTCNWAPHEPCYLSYWGRTGVRPRSHRCGPSNLPHV